MQNTVTLQPRSEPLADEAQHRGLQLDPHWQLAQRVVAGPRFARSPLLSKFLLFVVAETLEGRGNQISEHEIGVHVFDRRPGYRTVEDNIVRNYARQLRKRLADHFAEHGRKERVRIDIPVGGYVPVFLPVSEDGKRGNGTHVPTDAGRMPQPVPLHSADEATSVRPRETPGASWKIAWLLAPYSVVLVAITWYAAGRAAAPHPPHEPAQALWSALFGNSANSYIVPSDAGFNLLEDLSRQPVSLASYIAGSYEQLPLPAVDPHSATDLRTQQLTPFVDLQIASAIAHLAEDDPRRVFIRFPRDLRLDDLKNANAVIIGSLGSNPWAALAESSANFRIADQPGMSGAEIINQKLQAGEARTYASHWNEPSHETFALIEFLPNLSGNGHLLILEGLDVAGTQAAAEVLLHSSAIEPVLRLAARPDRSLRNFEVLLRSTSIESNAAGTQVIATRIHP
jgi:hypothetical protein